MKHILWVSRHPPTEEQIKELGNVLGEPNLVFTRHDKSVERHEELVELYKRGKYDDMVVTLPIELIGKLCRQGIRPIRAVHEMVGCDSITSLRIYKFLRFERIHAVTIKRERLKGGK
jgi:DNA-binding Lrp family transcriptional regulator